MQKLKVQKILVLVWLALLSAGCQTFLPAQIATPTPDRFTMIPPEAEKLADPLPPEVHHPGWADPVPVPGLLNSTGLEDSAFITPDGLEMIFFFTPTIENPPEMQVLDGVTGIYLSQWTGAGWGAPQRIILAEKGQPALDGCGTLVGDELWFCSVREGNLREIDIWRATRQAGEWTNIRSAGERLNVDYQVGEMHINPAGDRLIYHTTTLPGAGGMDIWQTRLVDGEWQPPENLSAVNTPEDEGWPFLSEDGTELWFTRFYQGSPAVFRSVWQDRDWSAPELIVSSFAGEPTLDAAGNLYFTHHIIIDGVIREADIYLARRVGD
ncbi:MAG: PD40 domain-containing protein [Anaerolineales bacterium]|nr:PD40 domain-containing protein [Anaerolineales bacterium]